MKIHMKLDLMYWKGVLRTARMNSRVLSMKACRSTLARSMTCSDDTTNNKSQKLQHQCTAIQKSPKSSRGIPKS